jgi:hypothetical protein
MEAMGEYATITVEPLTAVIGAHVDGVDLTSRSASSKPPRSTAETGFNAP